MRIRFILIISIVIGLVSISAKADNRPPSEIPLWQSYDTLSFRLEAPFKTLFDNLPSTNAPGSDDSPALLVSGQIAYKNAHGTEVAIPVRIRVRGHSSKVDCPFPKLDIKFDEDTDLSKTVFANARGFKVGTHCGDIPGVSGKYGRLRNQLEPHREALIYRIFDILQVQSYAARPARVTYVFTGEAKKSITRNAFLIETNKDFEDRYQAKEIFAVGSDEEAEAEAKAAKKNKKVPGTFSDAAEADVDINQAAMAYAANAMLANPDFDITVDGQSKAHNILWNTKAYIRKDGAKFLVPYDFDLVYMVVDPTRTDQMTSQMDDFVVKFTKFKKALADVKSRIKNKKSEILQAVRDFDWIYNDSQTGAVATDEAAISLIPAWLNEVQSYIDSHL